MSHVEDRLKFDKAYLDLALFVKRRFQKQEYISGFESGDIAHAGLNGTRREKIRDVDEAPDPKDPEKAQFERVFDGEEAAGQSENDTILIIQKRRLAILEDMIQNAKEAGHLQKKTHRYTVVVTFLTAVGVLVAMCGLAIASLVALKEFGYWTVNNDLVRIYVYESWRDQKEKVRKINEDPASMYNGPK